MVNFLLCFFVFLTCQGFSLDSYSLKDKNGIPLDIKLINEINLRNGVFVEVGANDGIDQSNTMLLEKYYGWTGVLIEPSRNIWNSLVTNRPNSKCFCCALGSFEEDNTYIYGDFNGSPMSSVLGKRLNKSADSCVLMRSLQSILEELNIDRVNLFSLDVEGYEYNILMGIDYNKIVFDYILIEIYASDYDKICSFLRSKGYELLGNFSLYDSSMLNWDGTHNDYLFKRVI